MKSFIRTPKFFLICIAFLAITVAAVVTSCDFYRIVPLYVSLLVLLLQTGAYRICFLIGGLNAAYYAVVYFCLKLYGMALYSICVACPIQIVTYLRWRSHAYGHSAVLRRLSARQRVGWTVGAGAAWAGLYGILSIFDSGYIILDNSIAILGAVSNFASFLYLIEFPFIQIVVQVLNLILYSQIVSADLKQWTYLIYTIYALICAILSLIRFQRLYQAQQKAKDSAP